MPDTTNVPEITLNDGRRIPQLGFGVFQIDPEDTHEAVAEALRVGYRHIDTAEMYRNEEGVGSAVRESGIARDDIWITSKLANDKNTPDEIREAFDETLRRLDTDHVDLFLIHWPLPSRDGSDFAERWKALEGFHSEGRARSIGVSNFQVDHLRRLAEQASVVPAVNQIEVHPYFGNEAVREYDAGHGIATEAWSPIAQGAVLDDPVITAIASDLRRSPAQVVLRWHVQRDDIVFPKSSSPERMRENFGLFDFALSDAQMEQITELDRGEEGRTGPHPEEFTG